MGNDFIASGKLNAAVTVTGNLRNRCLGETVLPIAGEHRNLPLINLVGSLDSSWSSGGRFYGQWLEGKALAQRQSSANIAEHVIPGKGHLPMPEEVFFQIDSFQRKSK